MNVFVLSGEGPRSELIGRTRRGADRDAMEALMHQTGSRRPEGMSSLLLRAPRRASMRLRDEPS